MTQEEIIRRPITRQIDNKILEIKVDFELKLEKFMEIIDYKIKELHERLSLNQKQINIMTEHFIHLSVVQHNIFNKENKNDI